MAKKKKVVKKPVQKLNKKPTQKPAKKVAGKKPTIAKVAKTKVAKTISKKNASKSNAKKSTKASVKKAAVKPVVQSARKHDLKNLMTPLDDRILVEPVGQSDRTPGGLFIPDTVMMERKNQGLVLAVGRGHINKKGHLRLLDVKVGDQVLFESYAGDRIQVVGQELVILRESEVLGILS